MHTSCLECNEWSLYLNLILKIKCSSEESLRGKKEKIDEDRMVEGACGRGK